MTEKSLNNIPETVKARVKSAIYEAKKAINGRALLMAATKTVDVSLINYAITECSLTDIGENRVQELLSKYDDLERTRLIFILSALCR